MNQEEFTLNVRSIIEDDPKEVLLDSVDAMLRHPAWQNASEEQKNCIVEPLLQPLLEAARPCIRRRDFATLNTHSAKWCSDLIARVAQERREGILKPYSRAAEFARFTNKFFEERWDGNTLDGARALLKPNARILGVSLRQIDTDAGPILRSDVIAYLLSQRPQFGDTISDDAFVSKFFTSENTLIEIEKARAKEEHDKQNPVHRSGPPSLIGTPIEN